MPVNEYHFVNRWCVEGTVAEVSEVIENARELPRWWPSVYLEVEEREPGGEGGVGKLISLRAKGWLPYTLRINFRTIESRSPHGFTLEASGDLEGVGVWSFEQDGPLVNITYDWRIHANKPLIRALSFLLKPIFASNHRWTMRRGEQSLKLELARRRARTPEEAARIASPPGPTFPHNLYRGKKGAL
ncbi:MAG TPA: hypothetical protein VGX92_02745 [Pyrinomonadaceae bacterium]|jgi:hypothetical protein|nr:hypothetical protein [Pyrinomonadaceae bacterium]